MDTQPVTPIGIIPATAKHIPAIAEIYAQHVLHGNGTFEETPPDATQMLERFNALQAQSYPYLVAILEGAVVGFAYAGPHKARSAYRFTVENSIYVNQHFQGKRIGYRLLDALIRACEQGGYKQMMAVIGDSNNVGSIALHKAAGFELLGMAKSIGHKHGQWLDVVYMQRGL